MVRKSILFVLMSLFLVISLIAFTSATVTFDSVEKPSPYGSSFDVKLTSDQNETIALSFSPVEDSDGNQITFDAQTFSVNASEPMIVNVSYDTTGFNFDLGNTYSTTMTANGSVSGEAQKIVSFEKINFCGDAANEGDLSLDIRDMNVVSGYGDDDNYWYLFDSIEIELRVENNGNGDIKNIQIDWELYTTDGKRVDHGDLSDFKLRDGDEDTQTFTIDLDRNIDDFDGEDAVLYVRAKGEIDDSNSIYDGDDTCSADSQDVEVRSDEDFVILNNLKLNSIDLNEYTLDTETLTCGQEVTLTGDAWNIGDSDQRDVYVRAQNSELGFGKDIIVGDVDAFDNNNFDYTFTIPSDASEKWYLLKLDVYDRHDDIFENSEDDQAKFSVAFQVDGCNIVTAPTVSANLETEAIGGKEMTVKATLTNTGDNEALYSLALNGYESWSTLQSFDGDVVRLSPGESTDVYMTLNVNKGVVGDKLFNLVISSASDGEILSTQPIGVSISESRTKFRDFFRNNWKLAGIVLLNLILVIAIIIVAVRIYRR